MNVPTEAFLGLHIPKCAGSSLLARIRTTLAPERIYQSTNFIENWEQGQLDFPSRNCARLRFVWGHFITEEMIKLLASPVVLMTGLREPRDRMRSEILHQQRVLTGQGLQPDQIHQGIMSMLRTRHNPMVRQICASFPTLSAMGESSPGGAACDRDPAKLATRAVRCLEHFEYVWFPDTFEAASAHVLERLGGQPSQINDNISDVASTDFDETELLEEAGVDDSFYETDRQFYRLARERFRDTPVQTLSEDAAARLLSFQQSLLNRELLRERIYQGAAEQYAGWGVLDDVIEHRSALIDELQAEVVALRKHRRRAKPWPWRWLGR